MNNILIENIIHKSTSANALIKLVLFFLMVISALTVYDKQHSYWLGVHWERIVISDGTRNHIPALKITYSEIPQLKLGDVLTHIQKDGKWIPLNSIFLLGLLDASESTEHLNKTIQLDGWLYANRQQVQQFKLADNRIKSVTPKAMFWKI